MANQNELMRVFALKSMARLLLGAGYRVSAIVARRAGDGVIVTLEPISESNPKRARRPQKSGRGNNPPTATRPARTQK